MLARCDGAEAFQWSATTLAIDWEKETAIPELEYSTAVDNSSEDQPVQGRTVILNGATDFLGGHILQHLVASERVAQVHCIAIRQQGATLRDLPIQSKKIVVHYGDLSLPRLGLSEAAFTSLSALADAIIHSGADVSFLKSYTSIRKPQRRLHPRTHPRCRAPPHRNPIRLLCRHYRLRSSVPSTPERGIPTLVPAQRTRGLAQVSSR